MPSPRAVLLTPSKPSALSQLPFCQQPAFVNRPDATLTDHLASAANKRLTENLSPVDAILTKNHGVCSRTSQPSNLPTFKPSNDPRPNPFPFTSLAAPHPLTPIESHPYKNHRGVGAALLAVVCPPFLSTTYKLPIFYPLSFHIHPCNGWVYPPLSAVSCRLSTANCQLPTANCPVSCPTPSLSRNEQTATHSLLYMHPVLSSPLCLWGIALSCRRGGRHE
jgi:hypothetical protein